MKTIILFLTSLTLFSCSNFKEPAYMRRHPGSHILTQDKKVLKDNIKYTKDHQKAARARREELAKYLRENEISTDHKNNKKSKNEFVH